MDKVDAYSDFLEWLTNTEVANYSSKRDLENYDSQIKFAKDEKARLFFLESNRLYHLQV
jgi:hypothetical protein